jgi:hypothetical protein
LNDTGVRIVPTSNPGNQSIFPVLILIIFSLAFGKGMRIGFLVNIIYYSEKNRPFRFIGFTSYGNI